MVHNPEVNDPGGRPPARPYAPPANSTAAAERVGAPDWGAIAFWRSSARALWGIVWKATDTELGRMVAVKALPQGVTCDEARCARYRWRLRSKQRAAGIVHRDFKPGNAMLSSPATGNDDQPDSTQTARASACTYGLTPLLLPTIRH